MYCWIGLLRKMLFVADKRVNRAGAKCAFGACRESLVRRKLPFKYELIYKLLKLATGRPTPAKGILSIHTALNGRKQFRPTKRNSAYKQQFGLYATSSVLSRY